MADKRTTRELYAALSGRRYVEAHELGEILDSVERQLNEILSSMRERHERELADLRREVDLLKARATLAPRREEPSPSHASGAV